jgi:hypothetical protein
MSEPKYKTGDVVYFLRDNDIFKGKVIWSQQYDGGRLCDVDYQWGALTCRRWVAESLLFPSVDELLANLKSRFEDGK